MHIDRWMGIDLELYVLPSFSRGWMHSDFPPVFPLHRIRLVMSANSTSTVCRDKRRALFTSRQTSEFSA